mmetsp:Transcript_153411/g.268216  ORF Transcript_153411/g.268216 Transcript_153411/m.268216 type:complete len:728 (-) Transcript_153411:1464-3647(-)
MSALIPVAPLSTVPDPLEENWEMASIDEHDSEQEGQGGGVPGTAQQQTDSKHPTIPGARLSEPVCHPLGVPQISSKVEIRSVVSHPRRITANVHSTAELSEVIAPLSSTAVTDLLAADSSSGLIPAYVPRWWASVLLLFENAHEDKFQMARVPVMFRACISVVAVTTVWNALRLFLITGCITGSTNNCRTCGSPFEQTQCVATPEDMPVPAVLWCLNVALLLAIASYLLLGPIYFWKGSDWLMSRLQRYMLLWQWSAVVVLSTHFVRSWLYLCYYHVDIEVVIHYFHYIILCLPRFFMFRVQLVLSVVYIALFSVLNRFQHIDDSPILYMWVASLLAMSWSLERGERSMHILTMKLAEEVVVRRAAEKEAKEAWAAAEVAREEAESAKAAQSLFLARMSHELRTPVAGLTAFMDLLRLTKLDDLQQDYAESMSTCSAMLQNVINNVLDFSKLEAGKTSLDLQDCEVAPVFHQTVKMFEAAAKAKDLSMHLTIHNHVPKRGRLDAPRVQQMLSNLISNAIKYTADGRVTICVNPIMLDNHEPGIKVEVTDTGTGVPLHLQHKLFNSFSQADETISRKFGGTGLGLSIVKSLALLMRGFVGIQSDAPVALGSTFYFAIAVPAIADVPSKPLTPAISSCSPLFRPLHFLVVDDTPMNLKLMDRQLTVMGCKSTLVESGQKAVEVLQEMDKSSTLPDVVLMDVWMPEMDGFQTTSAILSFFAIPTNSGSDS